MSGLKPITQDASAVQAVFDALDAFMAGTEYTNSNATVTVDGGGLTHTINASDKAGNSVTYTERTAGKRVAITPGTATLTAGGTQQFTASATDETGAAIAGATFVWSMFAGALGTVDATGLYTAPATLAANGMDSVTATLTGEQAWASVTVALDAGVKRG